MITERQDTRIEVDRSTIMATVVRTLEDLVQDWEIDDPIGPDTRVVADLSFESIDLIQMVGALEQAFGVHSSSFVDMLVADGRYVSDLSVTQIADGVAARIGKSAGK